MFVSAQLCVIPVFDKGGCASDDEGHNAGWYTSQQVTGRLGEAQENRKPLPQRKRRYTKERHGGASKNAQNPAKIAKY